MSEKQKSYAKWTVALVALLGLGGAGADAAGYDPTADIGSLVGTLKDLGLLGLGGLIWYLHQFWYPVLKQANERLGVLVERSDTSEQLHQLAEDLDAKRQATKATPATGLKVIQGAVP